MNTPLLELLKNQIDITRVPFSDRGSRLIINQYPTKSRLFIKLAERLISLESGLETYLQRLPFIQELCFIDEQGAPLDFETITSPEKLEFVTRIGSFFLVFQDGNTLSFGLPPNIISGISFQAQTSFHWQTNNGGELKHVRDMAYATNGKVVKNVVSIGSNGHLVEFIVQANEDCAVTIHISNLDSLSHVVMPFSAALGNARIRWQSWFERAPQVAELYRQKYAYSWWVMANNLVSPLGFLTREAMMPTKAFYLGAWLWDSAIHAIAFRHVDSELARDQLRLMLAHQLPDGMLPDAIFDEGVVSEIGHPISGKVTKPPILAWAALKLHETDPNLEFLNEIYPSLVRCNNWWFGVNGYDTKDLLRYSHPYSSGLDNSPLWDYGMPVESPDINTYMVMQMDALGMIADLLGKEDEGDMWRQRAKALIAIMFDNLWDEETGLFNTLQNNHPIPVLTPFNLYPLWTGHMPENVVKKLIAHLKNPDEFWGKYMIPTVARNDPLFNPEAMWRGPVWANINYFFVEALQLVGEIDLAREIRNKTLEMIMDEPGIYEYYNSETGKPPATSANMFGWTAAVFIELALQATAELESVN